MGISSRDRDVLSRIILYCDEVKQTHFRFTDSKEGFMNDFVYRNAIALCVLQIGELAAHLSEDFRTTYSRVPWRAIKAMRNFVAHQYGDVDPEILWETSHARIEELRAYCGSIVENE